MNYLLKCPLGLLFCISLRLFYDFLKRNALSRALQAEQFAGVLRGAGIGFRLAQAVYFRNFPAHVLHVGTFVALPLNGTGVR